MDRTDSSIPRLPLIAVCLRHRLDAEALAYLLCAVVNQNPARILALCAHDGARIVALRHSIVLLDSRFDVPQPVADRVRRLSMTNNVIMLGSDDPADLKRMLLAAGASSWINAESSALPVVALVRQAMRGEVLAGSFDPMHLGDDMAGRPRELTARELDVIRMYCTDPARPIEAVADVLGLSTNTVRAHLANVRSKMGGAIAPNRTALRDELVRRGLLPE